MDRVKRVLVVVFAGLGVWSAAQTATTKRLLSSSECFSHARKQPWGTYTKPIPSTVIDVGILKHVPYSSYRAGDYEINVYGDPTDPAGVEVGVYRSLLNSQQAKSACLRFMEGVLVREDDRGVLRSLNLAQDTKQNGGLTFEVTPPTAPDSYGGWWISIYNTAALDAARASDKELADITERRSASPSSTPKSEVPAWIQSMERQSNASSWSAAEAQEARPAATGSRTGDVVYVKAYTRKDGTYVRAHTRSKPSKSK